MSLFWATYAWLRGLSFEQWGLLLSLLVAGAGLLVGIGALLYARRASRTSDRTLEVSEEELKIAREEALRYPKLQASDGILKDADEYEDIVRTREAMPKWREVEGKLRFREEPNLEGGFDVGKIYENLEQVMEEVGDYKMWQLQHKGPLPDLVLLFELRNVGRRTAREVSGTLSFEPGTLKPLTFPGMSGHSVSEDGTRIELQVGTVPPAYTDHVRRFRVALLKESDGRTSAKATFVTPEGDMWEEALVLDPS